MKQLIIFGLAWTAFVGGCFAGATLATKTFTFPLEKCHCDVPDGWKEKESAGNKLSAINADETKSFTLRTVEVKPDLILDNPAFINGFEGSVIKNGFSIINRSHAQLGGIDAYIVECTQSMPAGTVTTRIMTTIANGYAYGISVAKLNGKPMEDSELVAAVNSFGFIGVPVLPQSQEKTSPATTTIYSAEFKAFQIVSPGTALVHEVIEHPAVTHMTGHGDWDEAACSEIRDQVYLVKGLPTDLADGDTWRGNVYRAENSTYTTAANTIATMRTYVVAGGVSNQAPTLNTIPIRFPTGGNDVVLCWAIGSHGQYKAFQLPRTLAEELESLSGLHGHVTVDMIKEVQDGDSTAADSISTGLSAKDKETLLRDLKAAKFVGQ